MANSRASAASVQKKFGFYRDAARRGPVTVTHHGRPSVVILAAEEYERLKRLDHRAFATIRKARIPKTRRYKTNDL